MAKRDMRAASAPLLEWAEQLHAAKHRRRVIGRRAVVTGIGVTLLGLTMAFPPAPRLVWNASASATVGLYAVSPGAPVDSGDIVIARVPERWRKMAAQRRYIPANVPLVKRVAAVAGDEVCALGHEIFVNGEWRAERRAIDASGRPMPGWNGCVRLRGRQLFLLMTRSPASFDGRYFGVTEGGLVVGKARLLWPR
ncbi:S26 family signal peptidase [Sphingomonas sp. NFR15]|uniref:S26 family signal peptidase n=1 Tax=Sphingomonas sp. NFR15 TaxID=1566282 RepID=UPI00088089DA|nr:S26 family signal peptidase [Sphingomonas sp. NFR15]SDA36886.1 conjugative transfer signal peptidase TraF [Sphingomonas sp. NFR15]